MNLDFFTQQHNEKADLHNTNEQVLETPFLECVNVDGINELLLPYYQGDFDLAIYNATAQIGRYEDESGLYHLVACSLFNLNQHEKAKHYFEMACHIVNSYHAVYHFVGYCLYYNRATLNFILQNREQMQQDLNKAQFLYHQNNPEKDIPLEIHEENLHFKNPAKDMLPKQKTISHLSIFKESDVERGFWESLTFFEKRQWSRASATCNKLISQIDEIHLEYHCFSACMFYNKGVNEMKLQNYGEAIDSFSRAIAFDLRNPLNGVYKSALKEAKNFA